MISPELSVSTAPTAIPPSRKESQAIAKASRHGASSLNQDS